MTLNVRLLLAIFIVFILTILPLPALIMGFRPPVIVLFVLYVQYFLPHYFNTILLLFIGLCIDVLLSTAIGEHAFALLLISWLASGKARRFPFYTMAQQMMIVFLLCFIYQLIIFLIEAFLGFHNSIFTLPGSALLSFIIWPWLRILADDTLLMRRM